MPRIPKELAEITAQDLQSLCDREWMEDEQIDFKETIPHREGESKDPWRDERRIKDHGRDQLLAAVVAFANSYGGDLVVGIKEGSGSPGRAESLAPIPACEEAGHRLAQAANACIDPPLASLQVRAVPTDAAGGGVLILRTGVSRAAPHRLSTTKECYHRVRHETLPMTMRQVQDLTFKVSRGLEAVDRRRTELRQSFRAWSDAKGAPARVKQLAYRVTCIPTAPECQLDRVYGVDDIKPTLDNISVKTRGREYAFGPSMHSSLYFRPMLRGTEAGQYSDTDRWRVQLYCDGAITYEFWKNTVESEDDALPARERIHLLYPEYLFGVAINAFDAADRFRRAAAAGVVDYACDIEIATTHSLPVPYLGQTYETPHAFSRGIHSFPTYVVGGLETRNEVLSLMWRDFWNALGLQYGDSGLQLS
ncbi:MAG TPA: ATP-binding protein [Steroidobacteraceae bacterium]